jgi:glutamate-5-semialdehyde dehydrogenase
MDQLLSQARQAYLALAPKPSGYRNGLLSEMRKSLLQARTSIEQANAEDLEESRNLAAEGKLSKTLVDRLSLSGAKFDNLMNMVDSVERLEDPLNIVTYSHNMLEDGSLTVHRVSCPIGVMAVIFESRPEAAVQIASLCIKSGNAVILKGGKEARRTCLALVEAMQAVPGIGNAIQLIESREDIKTLLSQDKYVDLVIPRGGADLVKYCKANTSIPVLGHADGICSVYVDKDADIDMAKRIIVDAKTQYPAVCNSAETLLVHRYMAGNLKDLVQGLIDRNVELRCCAESYSILKPDFPSVNQADYADFRTEYCDLIMAVKIVESIDDAISHINSHGSHHSDAIITANSDTAEKFFESIDSADVMWNASTRFADGNRFGFGAEVGVSTNKIHARGPVGLEGLTTYKYRIYGNGNTVGSDGPRLAAIAKPLSKRRVEDVKSEEQNKRNRL